MVWRWDDVSSSTWVFSSDDVPGLRSNSTSLPESHSELQVHIPTFRRHPARREAYLPPLPPPPHLSSSKCVTREMAHSLSPCAVLWGSLLGDGTIGTVGEAFNCYFDLHIVKLLKIAILYVIDLVE